MTTIRKFIFAGIMMFAVFALVIPAFAQDSTPEATPSADANGRTITITQDQITQRVSKISTKRFSDVSVTLGSNQITVAFTFTPVHKPTTDTSSADVTTPSADSADDASADVTSPLADSTPDVSAATAATQYAIEAVLDPSIQNGRVHWDVASLTVNGKPATADQLTRFSTFAKGFADRVRAQRGNRKFQVTDISITPEAITVTVARIV